jgi:hypothetical protein
MKQVIYLFAFIILLLAACEKEEIKHFETGTIVDYAGSGSCGIIIELDNGDRIQPLYYPDGFIFSSGQRVLVEYSILPNIIPTCDRGLASNISYIEELSCTPYVDLYFSNYDSLGRDPVIIQEIFVDGNCLQIKLSYSGGCKTHTIDLARMHQWFSGSPSIPVFEIRHNANNDMCEALFTRELRFDLSNLRDEKITKFVVTAKLNGGEVYNELFELK